MLRKADIEWLPLRSLIPHPRLQRQLINARVKHLRANFTPDGLGVITIWLSGSHAYIIDGQHRWRAGMDTGHGETKVKCHVYRNADLRDMAKLFLLLNDSRHVSALDKFNIGLVAEDEECLAIATLLAKYNLRLGRSMVDGYVRCVDRLRALYKRDPQVLEEVLQVATEAWGTRAAAVDNLIITALGKVLDRYNGQLDRRSLAQRLARYPGGPAGLIGNARGLSAIKPIGTARAAAEIIVDAYNAHRRNKKLPPL